MRLGRESYIPPGSICARFHGIDADLYLFTSGQGFGVVAFGGRRHKPDLSYRYPTLAAREEAIKIYLDSLRRRAETKQSRREQRKGFRHGYKLGDVILHTWGWEQTNADFYQVVAATLFTVTLRQIASHADPERPSPAGSMTSYLIADKDSFLEDSKPFLKRVQPSGSDSYKEGFIPMRYGCAAKWDGEPAYSSWYA